jgi:mycofactocin biosynthetic radical S-adenosylmethionine protein MftC
VSAEAARMGLRAPVNVTWEVTLKCNLACVHCLSDAREASKDELTTDECMRLIDHLAAIKVFQVNIGGGEPFMREDFFDLLSHAHEKGVVTCVSTNGTLMDRQLAYKLSKLSMFFLQVSLDGATPEVNDPIRGRGTYQRAIRGMEALVDAGVAFSVNMVLTRQNYPQLETMRALAGSYGATLRVSRFRPSGRGKLSRQWLGPDKDQLEAFAQWLERHDQVRTGDSFFCLTSENRRRKGLDMCGAAKMTCCVSPEGNVYPCAFLQEEPFLAGNVRELTLAEMWKHARPFHRLRNLDVESCTRCSRFESCRGGCPAVAFHTYQDIAMPDPECLGAGG